MSISKRTAAALRMAVVLCFFGAPMACDNEVIDPTPAPVSDLEPLRMAADTLPADGRSVLVLSTRILGDSTSGPMQVTFLTDRGSFLGTAGSKTTTVVDNQRSVSASLVAGYDTGTATIRAMTTRTSVVDSVHLVQAYPDTVLIGLSKFTSLPSDTITVSAVARRPSGGVPTRGTVISFSASAPGNPRFGAFGIPSTTDSTGTATARFSPVTLSPFTEAVTIRATITNAVGRTVSAEALLIVKAQDSAVQGSTVRP